MAAIFLIACAVAQAPVQEAGSLPVVPSKRWALVVGAKDYEHYAPLKYSVNDAKEFAQTLEEEYRFDKDAIKLLTDDAGPRMTPTAGHILGELEAQLADKRLNTSDLFIFFFAGHGVGTEKGDFLLPTDARKESAERVGLPVKELIDRFVKAGLKNVLIIADACRSGEQNAFGAELQELGRKANLAVMLGCAPGRRSYEYASLKHGAFASFLIGALKNPMLRDSSSGALWASKVGETVKEKVLAYTKPDHGSAAQDPSVWTEKTRDILLGAFPKDVSDTTLKSFVEQAKSLDKSLFASALIEFAEGLYDVDDYAKCVEVLKTVESLGELTPGAQYKLGLSLKMMDRSGEATAVLTKLSQDPDASYYKDLAMVVNPLRGLTDGDKLEASKRLWELDKSWWTGFLVWAVQMEIAPQADRISLMKELSEQPTLEPRQRGFMLGQIAVAEARYEDAIKLYQNALKEEGDSPSRHLIRLHLVPILEVTERKKDLDALTAEALKDDDAAYWWLLKARLAKERGDEEELHADIKKALSFQVDGDQMLTALHLVSWRSFALVDEFKSHAAKMPYSWKALLAAAISEGIKKSMEVGEEKGAQLVAEAVDYASKYADDSLPFMVEAFSIVNEMLTELQSKGVMSANDLATKQIAFFSGLVSEIDKFGTFEEAWHQLLNVGFSNQRNVQLARIVSQRLGPMLKPGSLSGTVRVYALYAAKCAGDDATVEKIMSQGGWLPADLVDTKWLHAIYLACTDRFKEAEKVLQGTPEPTAALRPLATALRAWLDAKAGLKEKSLASLAKVAKEESALVGLLEGLAYAELGDWKKAEPLLNWENMMNLWFTDVHAAAMRTTFGHALAAGDDVTADGTAFMASAMQPGNPLYAEIHFGPKAELSQFVGSVTLDVATWNDDLKGEQGSLTWTVSSAGKLTGVYENKEGKVRSVSGTVDKFGNLIGTVRGEGAEMPILGKIAPPELYGKLAGFKETGQILTLYSQDGKRTVWIGKPPAASKR